MYNDRSRPAYPLPGVTGMPKNVLEAKMCLLKECILVISLASTDHIQFITKIYKYWSEK